MVYFDGTDALNLISAGAPLRTPWGAYRAPPDPAAVFVGVERMEGVQGEEGKGVGKGVLFQSFHEAT